MRRRDAARKFLKQVSQLELQVGFARDARALERDARRRARPMRPHVSCSAEGVVGEPTTRMPSESCVCASGTSTADVASRYSADTADDRGEIGHEQGAGRHETAIPGLAGRPRIEGRRSTPNAEVARRASPLRLN